MRRILEGRLPFPRNEMKYGKGAQSKNWQFSMNYSQFPTCIFRKGRVMSLNLAMAYTPEPLFASQIFHENLGLL